MDGILLQDWTTIRVDGGAAVVYQAEDAWLDVDGYGDLIFWTEASHVLLGGGTAVRIEYETAPTKDESLFLPMASVTLGAIGAPIITKIVEGSAPVLPQAWVRWKLRALGSPPSTWGATLRVHCAANRRRSG